jgi:hypothetical protein
MDKVNIILKNLIELNEMDYDINELLDIIKETLYCYYFHTCDLYGESECEDTCIYLKNFINREDNIWEIKK